MKIDISKLIYDYDGNALNDETSTPLTIRKLLRIYAGGFVPAPGPNAGEESVIANALGLKIHSTKGELELTDEEFKLLEKAIASPRHPAVVYAQIYHTVYPKGKPKGK